MTFSPALIGRVFWSVLALESAAAVGLVVFFFVKGTKGSGPEGPVGAWLVLVPPVLLGALAIAGWWIRSDYFKMAAIVFMVMPLLQIALGPLYSRFSDYQTQRSLAGDDDFREPKLRDLAHAIYAHDAAAVERLIPGTGDLNRNAGNETPLRFAVYNAKGDSGLKIVQMLLKAGANANLAVGTTDWPLSGAIMSSAALTRLLLDAGADPNRLDGAKRPVWWDALPLGREDGIETLKLLLNHGADWQLRDNEGGPVSWAAYQKNWAAVKLLVEHGAPWRDEGRFGDTVRAMVQRQLEMNGAGAAVPRELAELAEMMK